MVRRMTLPATPEILINYHDILQERPHSYI